MNKISYLRKRINEEYNNKEYKNAVEVGEILLREHWHNRSMYSSGYTNDLFNLAQAYDELGNLERAAELYSDSARQLASLEGESVIFANRLSCLAITLGRMGIKEPAYFIHSQVMSVIKEQIGSTGREYGDSLYNLANAAADTGRKTEALRYHMDALKVRQNTGQIEDAINSLHSIAFLYENDKRYDKAVSYAEAAMDILEGSTIDDDQLAAGACNYLAGLYEHLKERQKALDMYEKVQIIIRRQVGCEHSSYMNVANRKANLLTQMGRPREALACHQEVCEIFQNISGKNHMFYANCLRNMAILHKTLGEDIKAESLILESMKIRKETEDITTDILFLIRLHLNAGARDKAMEALIYALMRSDSNAGEFNGLINALTEAFSDAGEMGASEIMDVMEALNDKEKLAPIISKWNNWEAD